MAKILGSNGNDTLRTIDLGGNALTREGRRALTYDLAGQNERPVTVCTSTTRHALPGPACFTHLVLSHARAGAGGGGGGVRGEGGGGRQGQGQGEGLRRNHQQAAQVTNGK